MAGDAMLRTCSSSSHGMNGSSRRWKRLKLRGSGTEAGGEWEAAGKRADAVAMPDVRLLNRCVVCWEACPDWLTQSIGNTNHRQARWIGLVDPVDLWAVTVALQQEQLLESAKYISPWIDKIEMC